MADCAAHVALAAVTALGWLGLGTLLLAAAPRSGDALLDGLNRLGVGALAFGLLTLAAGWAGFLYGYVYAPVLAVAALAGLPEGIAFARSARPALGRDRWPRWQLALAAVLAVYVLFAVVATCAPITSGDALRYHAADARQFAEQHRITEMPWTFESYQPYTVEMLVLDGFLLRDSVQGAFAPLLLVLASLAAVMGGASRIGGRRLALLAGTVFFAHPFMLWEATSTFAEPGLTLAVALAGWNVMRFARTGAQSALVLAGLFAGFAAGSKYIGIGIALLVAAVAVALARQKRAAAALGVLAPAALIAWPWYAKNWALTGNPLFPFVFGGVNVQAERYIDGIVEGYGVGRSPADAVLLPFRLLVEGDAFDRGDFFSPLFLMFAPAAFVSAGARRVGALVAVATIVYLGGWFLTSQQARFLLPLTPPLAVLAALGALTLAGRGRVARTVVTAATAAALALGLGVAGVYTSQFVPVVVGRESTQRFLAEKTPYHDGVAWLNAHLDRDERVLVGMGTVLYLDVRWALFSLLVLPTTSGPDETCHFARSLGVTHAAFPPPRYRRQLRYLGARLVARVPVYAVTSRTLNERGPKETMLVYRLTGCGLTASP